MAAIGLDFWGMLKVENRPENTGCARQERARLALKNGEKIDKKQVAKSIFISINDS